MGNWPNSPFLFLIKGVLSDEGISFQVRGIILEDMTDGPLIRLDPLTTTAA